MSTGLDLLQAMVLAAAGIHLLMALAVWSLLREAAQRGTVRLWTLAAVAGSAAAVISTYRPFMPEAVVHGLAPALGLAAFGLRVLALRLHLRLAVSATAVMAPAAAAALAYGAALAWPDLRVRNVVLSLAFAAAAAAFAWHARRAWRATGSHSAALLAWTEWPLVAVWLANAAQVALLETPTMPVAHMLGWPFLVLVLVLAVAAVYSNLAYLGMVLDDTRREAHAAREAQVAEAAARAATEHTAQALRDLLAERDRLAGARLDMLHLLAHEVRQPLHDIGAALAGAAQAARPPEVAAAAGPAAVLPRVQQAQALLGRVRHVLDNTLAAATVLTRAEPLVLQDIELGFMVSLVLGDLPTAPRARVRLDWQVPQTQPVPMDLGLVRLALRNLLLNALQHAGDGLPVVLQVAEELGTSASAVPQLVLSVQDQGPGLPQPPAGPVADPTPAPSPAGPGPRAGRGLGLVIVRAVAARHGGDLRLHNLRPGLRASLVLPLPG